MDLNQKIRITGYRIFGIKDIICPQLGETTWEELSKVLTPEERIVVLTQFEKGETVSFSWENGRTNYSLIKEEITI